MAGYPLRIGEYRIERLLDTTSTGLELDGHHLVLPRRAVVKLGPPGVAPAQSVLREACILEALHHPGVPRVYEAGLSLGERRPYLAREVVAGTSLASTLTPAARDARGAVGPAAPPWEGEQGGPLSIERVDVVALLRDIADILACAHGKGVVHGNLQPDRIVLTGRARQFPLCITDWGEARAHDAQGAPPRPSLASWYYAAPEVAAGEGLDDRADVFSLGVIAYRLLTGVLPFEGQVAVAADGSTQHVPTEVRCPEAPRELTQLVDQMLAHDHWDRPSSGEVQGELRWLSQVLAVPAASARGLVRIRKPRWTPALAFADTPRPSVELALDDVEPRDRD